MGNLSFERKEGVEAMLEHDPEKWKPVFRTDHAQTKRWDHDAIPLDRIMIQDGRPADGLAPASMIERPDFPNGDGV
jgi:hypothetical protein